MKKLLFILLLSSIFGTVTDIDGNVYETVLIGDQLWMAENLKVTHYNNGEPIQNVWDGVTTGAYGYYNDDLSNQETYGNLYNWYIVDDERGVCPEGWHVPSDDEWKELEIALSMSQSEVDDTGHRGINEGSKLAGNAALWNEGDLENDGRFGASGFNALPSGYHATGWNAGAYYSIGGLAVFWSTSDFIYHDPYSGNDIIVVWTRSISSEDTRVFRYWDVRQHGFSIRCVADTEMLGDLNGDQTLNVLDVILVVNMALGNTEADLNGDMNFDGIINILDVVLLVNIILGN